MVKEYGDTQLAIADGKILGPSGIVGWVDYGPDYIYVCFYHNKMIVAEHNNLDSVLTRLVRVRIMDLYFYAFRILCTGGVTAVLKWSEDNVVLVGITSGYYENGERIWTPASEIKSWPGEREK
jgi:hypothetical protein